MATATTTNSNLINSNNTPNSMIKSANSLQSSSSIMTSSNTSTNLNKTPNQVQINTNEDYLNKKITFIQNHINNLLIEITNLPEPWTYAVTEDGRVFFINEEEQRTTWLHPKTGQPVSLMIIPPIEDLPNGWQKDYILGLPYLIDHNTKKNYPINLVNNSTLRDQESLTTNQSSSDKTPSQKQHQQHLVNKNQTERLHSKMKNSPTKTNKAECQTDNSNLDNLNSGSSALSSSSTSSSTSTSVQNSNNISVQSENQSISNNNKNNEGNIIQTNTVQVNAAIDSALRKYGWLYKLSQNGLKLWRKRYFVLTDYILDYYSDSTMSKHCGTIFLNNTHSRPSIKKDGSSAYHKKNSFKVELVNSENDVESSSDMYIFLAAESSASMNEWINKFNFVSKLKNNSQNRNLYEKRVSNRSSSNTSTRTNASQSNYFIVKHDNSNSKKSSKSNSAPNSPGMNARNPANDNTKKLRSSLSSSSNKLDDKSNQNRKNIKKKLAFSDDEILNDRPATSKSSSSLNFKSKKKDRSLSDFENDNENNDRLNNSYNQRYLNDSYDTDSKSDNHRRSTSLNRSGLINSVRSSANSKFGSTNHIYDYKSIYDAFEKPIVEMTKMAQNLINSQTSNELYDINSRPEQSKSYKTVINSDFYQQQQQQQQQYQLKRSQDNYLDKNKIAEAAAAASAAMEKEKNKERNSNYMNKPTDNQSQFKNFSPKVPNYSVKIITNFYQITKAQLDLLQKSELDMLIRQLRRNFVLLNHSLQRFGLLQKLYEPYELIFQHRQNQQTQISNNKSDEPFNMNEFTIDLHDSYQTIKDRIKRIELKMDSLENGLKMAQNSDNNSFQKNYEDSTNLEQLNLNKFSNILKLYEYQIIEMQHENELLLEDKIIVDKLIDNQMRIFSKYQNLSNEKTLMQQFNALNQEMDLLKMQLSKVNQLLNDTISDKCKHELVYQQHLKSTCNSSQQSQVDSSSLFRASLIPIGNQNSSNLSINDSKTASSSIWKFNSPSAIAKKTTIQQAHSQFNSTDNLLNQPTTRPQIKNNYQPHHHQYCLNSNSNNNLINSSNNSTKFNDNNLISKSIDSIYSPTSSTSSTNKINLSTSNGYSAFNSINNSNNNKKQTVYQTDLNDDMNKSESTFQPVNFTNTRPKQLTLVHQVNPNTAFVSTSKNPNFKRDIIAEKKRSSIGKYSQNIYPQSRDYFQPIQIQNNQSARERLFGLNNQSQQLQQQNFNESEQINSRKIALVKPELRGACDNDLINRFTQQNQMEYFDADYSEEIVKTIQQKPDVYAIPRANMDMETEIEQNEDEKRIRDKRMIEIKKMIAAQTLQQMSLEEISTNSLKQNRNSYHGSSGMLNHQQNYQSFHTPDFNLEKEKRAREHLLELRHELAEQIKEKTRQSAAQLNNNNINNSNTPAKGGNSSTSNSIEIIDNRLNETPNLKNYFNEENFYEYCEDDDAKKIYEQKTYYSVQSIYNNDLINSTPTLPAQYKNFFSSTSILNSNK